MKIYMTRCTKIFKNGNGWIVIGETHVEQSEGWLED